MQCWRVGSVCSLGREDGHEQPGVLRAGVKGAEPTVLSEVRLRCFWRPALRLHTGTRVCAG